MAILGLQGPNLVPQGLPNTGLADKFRGLPRAGRRCCQFSAVQSRCYDRLKIKSSIPYRAPQSAGKPAKRRRLQIRANQGNGSGSGPASNVSVVLLAGGSGKRMGAPIPKQYLELSGQAIAMYSLQVFAEMPEVAEIVIVCNPEYRDLFEKHFADLRRKPDLKFVGPGRERQDSVYNGFKAIAKAAALVAIHDSARPLITADETRQCIKDASQVGAAVLGVPVKPTIKEVRDDGTVVKTLKRANLWEVQTPQIIQPELLQQGFDLVQSENLEVTDDVSIIEALGKPVKVTRGSYTNIKVTTPDDILVAEGFLRERESPVDVSAAA